MTREQDGEQAPAAVAAGRAAGESRDLFTSVPLLRGSAASESLTTVLVAFGANVLIAGAKSAAAIATGSASLVAEAAHSWADSGNEVFLLIANRRAGRPPDRAHPFGHGREAYESHVAVRLRALEAKISASPAVAAAVLSLSAPDEPSLEP